MKHLFVVHSNLTYLAALGVICRENLPLEDVRIFSPHFFVDEPVAVERLSFPRFGLNFVKVVDRAIDRVVGDDTFVAYVPGAMFPQNVFITHGRCAEFHFIDEGLSTCCSSKNLAEICSPLGEPEWRPGVVARLKNMVSIFRLGGAVLNAMPIQYDMYSRIRGVRCYSFFEEAFVNAPADSRVRISLNDVKERFGYRPERLDDRVLLLGTVGSTVLFGEDEYIDTVNDALDMVFADCAARELVVKFHPIESESSRRRTAELLERRGIAWMELGRQTMVEMILLASKNMTVIGCGSSLNFYAALMGHRSLSYAKRLLPANSELNSMEAWDKYVMEI